jgi:type I phosphodiesterase/nucleotide pyrophosphatase
MFNISKRAFIIKLDGAMGDAVRAAPTPRMDALLAGGVTTYSAQTVLPSSSFLAWGAMLYGVDPEQHQIDDEHPCPDSTPWTSFMSLAWQTWPACQLALFSCWEPINTHIIERSAACHLVSLPDPELVPAATEYIRIHDPKILFLPVTQLKPLR